MRWALAGLLVLHGVIHLLGPAKAFGLAELPQLTQPVSRGMGWVWLGAGLLVLGAALHLLVVPRTWWVTGIAAAALSQVVVVSAWPDAKFGTLANLVLLLAAAHAFASHGPLGLRAEYREAVADRLDRSETGATLGADDLAALPDPVRRYVEASGAVGRPVPTHFRARWRGRIRGRPEEPWMEFTAEQHNFLTEPSRFFFMDAVRGGLPVDVYHDFGEAGARMRVRLLSLLPLVDVRGPEMDRAETVTLLNDLALFAPGGLVDPAIEWEAVDDRTARARYAPGDVTVEALLRFDERGRLADFVSDDRLAASPDGGFVPMRWSTPVTAYAPHDGVLVVSEGEGRWHPEGEPAYTYIELELVDLEYGGEPSRAPRPPG